MNNELSYWLALTHMPKIWTSRKMEMIDYAFNLGKTIVDFFESPNYLGMDLTQDEISLLNNSKVELGNYAFMVEDLISQGYDVIPVVSEEYSTTLKSNLKHNSPLILYTKGNKQLLREDAIAIVGSRNAGENALLFADNIARKASEKNNVVVSGYAKGVDKQALDSAIKYNGHSIIVLPQGILTFSSGMKKYYKQIIAGEVLVLSTFYPRLPWGVELAMSRNAIIYGLASKIYAAQSDEKGGTWSGVCDGLKKNREIFIRMPEENEKCANTLLIEKGAIPVDIEGNKCEFQKTESQTTFQIQEDIIQLLKSGGLFKAKEIKSSLKLTVNDNDLRKLLDETSSILKTKKGNSTMYSYSDVVQRSFIF